MTAKQQGLQPADKSKGPAALGKAIRVRRRTLGYTQQEAADVFGVNQATVAKWERGDTMTPQHLQLVADFLGMSTSEAMERYLGEEDKGLRATLDAIVRGQEQLLVELSMIRAAIDRLREPDAGRTSRRRQPR